MNPERGDAHAIPPENALRLASFPRDEADASALPVQGPFYWWCSVCHRRTPFGYDQLARFHTRGWPVCCGEVVLGFAGGIFVD